MRAALKLPMVRGLHMQPFQGARYDRIYATVFLDVLSDVFENAAPEIASAVLTKPLGGDLAVRAHIERLDPTVARPLADAVHFAWDDVSKAVMAAMLLASLTLFVAK